MGGNDTKEEFYSLLGLAPKASAAEVRSCIESERQQLERLKKIPKRRAEVERRLATIRLAERMLLDAGSAQITSSLAGAPVGDVPSVPSPGELDEATPSLRYCRTCGAEIGLHDAFCVDCGSPADPRGNKLVSSTERVSKTVEPASAPARSENTIEQLSIRPPLTPAVASDASQSRRTIALAVSVVAVFAAICATVWFLSPDKKQRETPAAVPAPITYAPKPSAVVPSPTPVPTEREVPETAQPFVTQAASFATDAERQAIESMLDRWVQSFREKDLDAQLACYGPQLDRYYLKRDVPHSFVEQNKSRAFAAIAEIRDFTIKDINVTFASPQQASVTFDKDWDTVLLSGRPFAGSEMERLTVSKENGEWKITSEEEVKIYFVRRK